MEKRIIEVCVNGHLSIIEAQNAGASRVELCAALPEGGTTPSYGEIIESLKQATIPVFVIIRPRAGDFHFTETEISTMLYDIELCKKLGASGVVIGALTPEGEIDIETMKRLIEKANGLQITCHRAFDMCIDPFKAIDSLVELGCHRILTSGQRNSALEGVENLKSYVEYANGRISIMPGCGVSPTNILELEQKTGAKEFHLSGKTSIDSDMKFRNPHVSMGGEVKIDEYKKVISSQEIIKQVVFP